MGKNNEILIVVVVVVIVVVIAVIAAATSFFGLIHPLATNVFDKATKTGPNVERIDLRGVTPAVKYRDCRLILYNSYLGSRDIDLADSDWSAGVCRAIDVFPGISVEIHDVTENLIADSGDYLLLNNSGGLLPPGDFTMIMQNLDTGLLLGMISFSLVPGEPSITIYEQSDEITPYTFPVYTLMNYYGYFYTWGHEEYNVKSDGVNLTIKCFRNDWLSGVGVGNNIVAVKLNGATGYPEGLWASRIVNYTLGYNGTAESGANALGNLDQIGPYGTSKCTYLGDQYSEITLAFEVPVWNQG